MVRAPRLGGLRSGPCCTPRYRRRPTGTLAAMGERADASTRVRVRRGKAVRGTDALVE
jgi:hypothetical protein